MRTNALGNDGMTVVLRLLTPPNRLACMVSLATGLRIGDVLSLRSDCLSKDSFVITEEKTGKRRKVRLAEGLREALARQAGRVFVFEGRTSMYKHRTRQAVYKDIKRAAKAARLNGCIGAHSMRKTFAVRKYAACGDMRKVQKLLQHSNEAVTMLYVLADVVEFADFHEPFIQRT